MSVVPGVVRDPGGSSPGGLGRTSDPGPRGFVLGCSSTRVGVRSSGSGPPPTPVGVGREPLCPSTGDSGSPGAPGPDTRPHVPVGVPTLATGGVRDCDSVGAGDLASGARGLTPSRPPSTPQGGLDRAPVSHVGAGTPSRPVAPSSRPGPREGVGDARGPRWVRRPRRPSGTSEVHPGHTPRLWTSGLRSVRLSGRVEETSTQCEPRRSLSYSGVTHTLTVSVRRSKKDTPAQEDQDSQMDRWFGSPVGSQIHGP